MQEGHMGGRGLQQSEHARKLADLTNAPTSCEAESRSDLHPHRVQRHHLEHKRGDERDQQQPNDRWLRLCTDWQEHRVLNPLGARKAAMWRDSMK